MLIQTLLIAFIALGGLVMLRGVLRALRRYRERGRA